MITAGITIVVWIGFGHRPREDGHLACPPLLTDRKPVPPQRMTELDYQLVRLTLRGRRALNAKTLSRRPLCATRCHAEQFTLGITTLFVPRRKDMGNRASS